MNLSGIIPALVTPFKEDGSVNYDSLKELIKTLIAKGVGGFYACGSTAECFLLTDDERKKVLETVVNTVDGKVPVIAHLGNIGTDKTCELAHHAKSIGASAVSSVPPFYYKFSFEEIAQYYADIAKSAPDLPLIIYSIPAFSGVSINADNIGKIIDASGAQGLKYTDYNLFELEKISRKYPNLSLFNGHDELYVNALPVGIDAAIGSTFNVMPQKYIKLKEYFDAGNLSAAADKQKEINEIIEAMIKVGVNQSIKYWLGKSGISCGDCRKPFAPLTAEQRKLLDGIYDKVLN